MGLPAGTRLGAYEIGGLIGAGGMGEVYRATDTNLKRPVAIKVLPQAVATDGERLARFQREAEVLARLNHPNIAAIYGLEKSDGTAALVMELVEGSTLADRIAQGPIPLDEALPIAKQIAEALEAAHEQGIIHRDLKPANIKLREDGTVKVLDFGLAKLVDPTGAGVQTSGMGLTNSPTITTPAMTQLGVILGTAAYMSPEQAKGRPADMRSDIWAFGCVLYEMLTGKRAFDGEDVSDTLAAVLRADPDWTVLPADVPLSIRTLVQRCLAKDRRQRVAGVSIARYVMNEPAMAGLTTTLAPPLSGQPSLWGRFGPVVVAVVAASALTGVAMRVVGRGPFTLTVTRFALMLPEAQQFTGAFGHSITISPDGTQIVYVANSRLYVRLMPDFEARPIPGTETPQGISSPVFSPDGRSVAFYSVPDRTIKRIATEGGTAIPVCQVEGPPRRMTWTNDNILFGQGRRGIMRVSSHAGRPEPLISVSDEGTDVLTGPQMLPGDQAVLFTLVAGGKAQVVVQSLASSERTLLTEGNDARYLTTGHIVFWRGGTVYGVAFDVGRLRMMGEPAPLVQGVLQAGGISAAEFSVSDTGTLIYRPGPTTASSSRQSALVLVDRKGHEEALKAPPRPYESPRFSPDGKRVAIGTDDGTEANIWVYTLNSTISIRQLTFGGRNRYPIWSANGERIAFQSDRDGDLGIFWQRADGTDRAERLTTPDAGTSHIPESWSRTGTGERFSFSAIKADTATLLTFSLDEKKSAPFGDVRSRTALNSVFSPDGKWLAYTLREPPRVTSLIQPFPPTGAQYQIKADLAHHPMWSPDGKELFYLGISPGLEAVSVTLQPSPAFGIPVPLAGTEGFNTPYGEPRNHDIAPDGAFITVGDATRTESGAPAAPHIRVVLNWMEELKQRVPTR